MKMRLAAAATLAAVLAGGCSILGNPAPDASRYFVLSSTAGATIETPARTRSDVRLGLGPVKLPGYLDAQGVVSTGASGAVEYVPNAFWAEPLSNGFPRALLYRTGARIGTPNAVAFPWYSTTKVEWKVPVDVLRFEATADGHAVLVARWSVQRVSDGVTVAGAESTFEESAGRDPAAIVDALSRCIDRLAEAIAAGVTAVAPVPGAAPRAAAKKTAAAAKPAAYAPAAPIPAPAAAPASAPPSTPPAP